MSPILASQASTSTSAPATSKEPQMSPPPCCNNAFTSKPVVVPGTMLDKSKKLGSFALATYNKV